MVAATVAALLMEHLGHHAARADGQALTTEILTQPICRGGSPGDRATATAEYRIAGIKNAKE
ncbi:MAG: hypothetical protein ACREEP_09225 [Dongiaceae bacterium]